MTNKALTSNVATLTVTQSLGQFHGLIVGNTVTVAGVDATFNGTYTLTAVGNTSISYAKVAADVASTSATGTVTPTITGNLANFNDPAGSALASVNGAGVVTSIGRVDTTPVTGGQIRIGQHTNQTCAMITFDNGSTSNSIDSFSNNFRFTNYANGLVFNIAPTGATSITLASAAAVGLVVKGAASQSANLTEWQNSSSTVLASISSAGVMSQLSVCG